MRRVPACGGYPAHGIPMPLDPLQAEGPRLRTPKAPSSWDHPSGRDHPSLLHLFGKVPAREGVWLVSVTLLAGHGEICLAHG